MSTYNKLDNNHLVELLHDHFKVSQEHILHQNILHFGRYYLKYNKQKVDKKVLINVFIISDSNPRSRRFRIEFGIPNEIIRKQLGNLDFVIFRSEKVRKFELCHFSCRKKLGKLDLIILNGGKRCGNLDFMSFFMSEKVWKFELCNFLCRKKCGKLDFIIFIGKKNNQHFFFLFAKINFSLNTILSKEKNNILILFYTY